MKVQPVNDFSGLTHRAVDWMSIGKCGIPSDLEGVMNLFNLGIMHESFRYIPRSEPIVIAEVRQQWMRENPAVSHWITINENQEVVASAHVGTFDSAVHGRPLRLTIVVHPSYQRKGLGTILCNLIIKEVLQKSEQLFIYTNQDNQPMVALMKSLQKEFHVYGPATEKDKLEYIVTMPKENLV